MRTLATSALAIGLLSGGATAEAQRLPPPLPPPPVALSVPHPIPPVPTSPPRDLYLVNGPQLPPVITPGQYFGPTVFVPYGYGPFLPQPSAPPTPVAPAQGWLRFETVPGTAQVYIDGAYVGVVDDFGVSGRTVDLAPGRHHVELRATDYATQSFDVTITANQITRYRGDLQHVGQAPPPAASATAPATAKPAAKTYIIPNCYAGDRPPLRPLPSGCSVKQMVTR